MAKAKRVLVIGGVAAGMSAASQVKRRIPSAQVVVFEQGDFISYGACGIPYNLDDPGRKIEDLVVVTPEAARSERKLDVRLRHEIVQIDPTSQHIVVVDQETGTQESEKYDALVIATGARARQPSIPGIDHDRVFPLRDLSDGARLKKVLESKPTHATIVGGGYIAMEMAHILCNRGLSVSILEKTAQILPGWHRDTVARVMSVLEANEVHVSTKVSVKEIEPESEDGALKVVAGKASTDTDLVLVATGVAPEVALAAQAGLRMGDTGAVWVNQYQQTSNQNIWAAGDCAEAYHRVLRKNAWIPLGTTANKQGRIAGANASGEKIAFKGIVGTVGFLVFDLEVARTGLTLDLAKTEGFEPVAMTVKQRSRGHAYHGGSAIQLTLIADGPTGLLLGAEITGREGAAMRINVLATALAGHMTVWDLQNLDLVYAPPFAPVWDPVLVAANQLAKKIGGKR